MTEVVGNWEAIGVFVTIGLAALAGLGWIIKLFWGWRHKAILASQEDLVNEILDKQIEKIEQRIKTLEVDVKTSASKNVEMSQAFHSEINKILYLFTERE